MRRLFAALLLLASCSSSPATVPSPPPDDGSLKMPEHVWPAHVGSVDVEIEGDEFVLTAGFGVESPRCETRLREGACLSEICLPAERSVDPLPDAGLIEVRMPSGRIHELVPTNSFYESIRATLPPDAPPYSFWAHGSEVPPFNVDVETPGPLLSALVTGANPRSPNIDLEIAHEPFDADFELVLASDRGPRVRCSFTGGAAVVPKAILGTMERDRRIRASAFRMRERRISADDYAIDARVIRDRRDFELRLTPAEASSGP